MVKASKPTASSTSKTEKDTGADAAEDGDPYALLKRVGLGHLVEDDNDLENMLRGAFAADESAEIDVEGKASGLAEGISLLDLVEEDEAAKDFVLTLPKDE